MSPQSPTRIGTRGAGTRRDGRDEGEGRLAPRARAPCNSGSVRRTGPSCHLAATEGGRAAWRFGGETGARAPLASSAAVFSRRFPRAPSYFPFSLAVAPPPEPHVTQESPGK